MCSYNKVNGLSASENPWLLTTVLREELGFQGLVVSDWGAVYHRVPALLAGPGPGDAARRCGAARSRSSPPSSPARCRARSSTPGSARCWSWSPRAWPCSSWTSTFDAGRPPRAGPGGGRGVGRAAEERRRDPAARRRRPGSRSSASSPGPRGSRARAARRSTRPGSRTLLDELTARLRRGRRSRPATGSATPATTRRCAPRPVEVAAAADTVVMLIGLPGRRRVRGLRPHPHGPARQPARRPAGGGGGEPERRRRAGQRLDRRPRRGHAARARRWSRRGSAARRPAAAIADVLTGTVNPSGRLAETIPHRLEDNSSYLNFPGDSQVVRYGEGLFIGYRGYDTGRTGRRVPVRLRPVLHHASRCPT